MPIVVDVDKIGSLAEDIIPRSYVCIGSSVCIRIPQTESVSATHHDVIISIFIEITRGNTPRWHFARTINKETLRCQCSAITLKMNFHNTSAYSDNVVKSVIIHIDNTAIVTVVDGRYGLGAIGDWINNWLLDNLEIESFRAPTIIPNDIIRNSRSHVETLLRQQRFAPFGTFYFS